VFKPIFRYSKTHTYLTLFEEENEKKKCIYTVYPGHCDDAQNDKKGIEN